MLIRSCPQSLAPCPLTIHLCLSPSHTRSLSPHPPPPCPPRFGIDGRKTQPAPTLSNVRLYNQSCVSLLHVGFGPLVIAGMHIVVGSASAGHTAPAYLSGTPDLLPLPDVPECALLATGDGQKTSEELAGASSLIDVVLECDGGACAKRAALRSFRSMYLRNVVVARGFAQVLDLKAFDGNATVFSLAPSDAAYTSCSEVAAAVPIPGAGEAPVTVSIIVNNQTKSLPAGVIDVSPLALRPDVCTLLDKHGWGDNLRYPSLAQSSLVNVLDFGAQADGSRASSRQIQAAIDAAATRVSPRERTVFMPRGVYRVNESLVVPGNVSLLGVARHLTLLVADASVVERSGGDRRESGHPLTSGAREPAAGAPLVRLSVAEDTQETGTSSPVLQAALAQLMMTVPLNTTRGAHAWAFSAPADRVPARTGRAVSGGSGFLSTRQLWQTRVAACGSWFYNAVRRRVVRAAIACVVFSRGSRNVCFPPSPPFSSDALSAFSVGCQIRTRRPCFLDRFQRCDGAQAEPVLHCISLTPLLWSLGETPRLFPRRRPSQWWRRRLARRPVCPGDWGQGSFVWLQTLMPCHGPCASRW